MKETEALAWRSNLTSPHGVAWFEGTVTDGAPGRAAIAELFRDQGFPTDALHEIGWLRDALGKPFVLWRGAVAAWAEAQGAESRHLHVSNSHDGDTQLALAVYAEDLAGVGVDLVYLPRLRSSGKEANYLRRFARQFMSEREHTLFLAECANDTEEALRVRVAAHFSLMEAASKACGTGLKVGPGMSKPSSLPKRSLGAGRLAPPTELLIEGAAQTRLQEMGVCFPEAHWAACHDYLASVVLLWRAFPPAIPPIRREPCNQIGRSRT